MTIINDPYPSEITLFDDAELLIKQVWDMFYFFNKRYCLLLRTDGITIFDMNFNPNTDRGDAIIFRTHDRSRIRTDFYFDRDSNGRVLPSSKEKALKEMDRYLNLLVFS